MVNLINKESIVHDRNISTWIRKYGINEDVDGVEDIIAAGGLQTWLAAAATGADIDIVSSSGADAQAGPGTGAHTLLIEGLDADGMLQSEIVTMLGALDAHPAKDYLRIHRAIVQAVGTGGVNAGNITIDIDGSQTLAFIMAGHGQTQQAAYTIPADRYGWMRDFHVSMAGTPTGKTDLAAGSLMARDVNESWRIIENWQVEQSKDFYMNEPGHWPGIRLSPLADIRLNVAAVASANMVIAGSFYIEFQGVG